ncbi:MAG: hypothetical protein OEY23_14975 [Acidimicrobiia bacterium]|nr:hypothetical protein [Acidimicrobiia bacterium]
MPSPRPCRRTIRAALLTLVAFALASTIAAAGPNATPATATPATAPPATATLATTALATAAAADPGHFVALVPARLRDTRPGYDTVDGAGRGGGPTTETSVAVTGRAGVPATVAAVALNVTVTEPSAAGHVTVYPCGEPAPVASNLNFLAGQTVANAALARVGPDGSVCLAANVATHLVVDLDGYWPAGAAVGALVPARLTDTRAGGPTVDGAGSGGGVARSFVVQVAARGGVPNGTPTAMLNVTATEPIGPGYVTVHPCGGPVPLASNLNFERYGTVPNLVVAPLDAAGRACVHSSVDTHLVVDAFGHAPAGAPLHTLTPFRLADTRPGQPTGDGFGAGTGRLGVGGFVEVGVGGRGGVPALGSPSAGPAGAVVLNVTVTEPAAPGYATVYPCGSGVPLASNLNYVTGQTVANLVVAKLGAGSTVCVSSSNPAHVVVDVLAWLDGEAPPPAPASTTLAGCPIFPADNPWNQVVTGRAVRPESAGWVTSVGSRNLHPDFGSNPDYGIPFVVVGADQPMVPVTFDGYPDESDPGPYPIPLDAPIEGGGDRHVLALQQGTCKLYELFYARPGATGWTASNGATFDLRSNALRPDTWTSADAAGLAILPGLVRFDEVRSGRITHALRFTVPRTQRGFIHPATHFAGNTATAPPMGARFRLKADFDISGFDGDSRVILEALRTYGMIVADNGSGWYISGATDPRWNDEDLNQLKTVPGSAFEVVDTGPIRSG